jgi:hypothetical protein
LETGELDRVKSRRPLIVLSGALAVSWVVFALTVLADSNVELNGALFLGFLWIALFASGSAVVVLGRAWRGAARVITTVPVSLLALLATLWLAFLVALSNH